MVGGAHLKIASPRPTGPFRALTIRKLQAISKYSMTDAAHPLKNEEDAKASTCVVHLGNGKAVA